MTPKKFRGMRSSGDANEIRDLLIETFSHYDKWMRIVTASNNTRLDVERDLPFYPDSEITYVRLFLDEYGVWFLTLLHHRVATHIEMETIKEIVIDSDYVSITYESKTIKGLLYGVLYLREF